MVIGVIGVIGYGFWMVDRFYLSTYLPFLYLLSPQESRRKSQEDENNGAASYPPMNACIVNK